MTTSGPALYLLGGTELRGVPRDDADRLLAQSKAVALLALLTLAPRGRHQRRDWIVGLLWPELDQDHARTALRKTVYAIRGTLGADVIVSRGDEELALAEGALECDAVEFGLAIESGRLARALDLYRGELLVGFHLAECSEFGIWADGQRADARERAGAAALALSSTLERDDKRTDAALWVKRAVRYSRTDERVLRRAVSMLARLGDRAGALYLYDDFVRRLREELDAEPSRETVELIASLRAE